MNCLEFSSKFFEFFPSIYGQNKDNSNGTAPNLALVFDFNSTSTEAVELENRRYLDNLRNDENLFINLLLQSDFNDGFSNDAIDYLNKVLGNSFATCIWIAELFEKYSKRTDEKSKNIIYGLLKTIAYLDNHTCFDYIKPVLLLILKAAMHSNQDYMQEAALMVIEAWHIAEAYDILNEDDFEKSIYIDKYIKALKHLYNVDSEY